MFHRRTALAWLWSGIVNVTERRCWWVRNGPKINETPKE